MNKDPVTYNKAKLRRFHDTWLEKSSNALEEKKKPHAAFYLLKELSRSIQIVYQRSILWGIPDSTVSRSSVLTYFGSN